MSRNSSRLRRIDRPFDLDEMIASAGEGMDEAVRASLGQYDYQVPTPGSLTIATPGLAAVATPGVETPKFPVQSVLQRNGNHAESTVIQSRQVVATPGVAMIPTPGVEFTSWLSKDGHSYDAHEARPIGRVQDSMSNMEFLLYDTLYRQRPDEDFQVISEENGSRKVSVGFAALCKLCKLENKRSIRNLTRILQDKYALIIHLPKTITDKCTYEVFSYGEILRRQRADGYTHRANRGKAIELVRQAQIVATPGVGTDATPGGVTTPGGGVETTPGGGVGTGSVSLSDLRSLETNNSSSKEAAAAATVENFVAELGSVCRQQIARSKAMDFRDRALSHLPNISDQEIVTIVAQYIEGKTDLENPFGLVFSYTADVFTIQNLLLARRRIREENERLERIAIRDRELLEQFPELA